MIMKKFIFFAALLAGVISLQAQHTLLSPQAAIKALEIREGKCQTEYVHAFVTLAEGADIKALMNYGVKINSTVGNMMTAHIPAKRYNEVVASGLCSYIDLAREVQLHNDLIRDELGIDYIHNGINLPQGFDGTGVVVGVIDVGLYYGHPSFYDTTGSTLRIKRVWQQLDTTGNPPAGFSYGRELTTPEEMLAAVTDRVNQGHGSHVAGMAAGCGAPDGNGRRYRGMAPAADIVMVGTTMQDDGVFDGIRYIHEYARSVGKPCVINMSLGSIISSHDGTDAFTLMTENYMQGGTLDSIVLMVSAGNEGSTQEHLHHQFSPTDTMIRTYASYATQDNFRMVVDCWGDVDDQFSLKLTLNKRTPSNQFNPIAETPFFSSDVDSVYTFTLTADTSEYQCFIAISHNNPINQRPEIAVVASKSGRAPMSDIFSLTLKSDSADVHCWSLNHDLDNYNDPQFVAGDNEYTVSGVGTNGDAVICVGSYTTRNTRVDENNVASSLTTSDEGGLSFFSSRGPTWDGRTKPDICSPGEYIVSVFSTPYMPYYPANLNFDSTVFNGETYYYCLMRGTSMAAPSATGIVALWLQQNPSLSVSDVRSILHSTARQDHRTGNITASGDNNWGWGKINAYGGLPSTMVPMHHVDATADNRLHGVVIGRGTHPEGTISIEAVDFNGYDFREWNDGNTDNPRIINLTSDTTFVAYFDSVACDTITRFPWQISSAEGYLKCWENYSALGQLPWTPLSSVMVSATPAGMQGIDNWLVSPYLIPEANTSVFATFTSINSDSVAIVAITDAGDTVILANEEILRGDPIEIHADLTPYAGQPVRFAFHHYATATTSALMLMSARVDYLQGIEDAEVMGYRLWIDGLTLNVNNPDSETVSLYDVTGRQLATSKLSTFNHQFSTPGVYIVKVGDRPARKVVVIR